MSTWAQWAQWASVCLGVFMAINEKLSLRYHSSPSVRILSGCWSMAFITHHHQHQGSLSLHSQLLVLEGE